MEVEAEVWYWSPKGMTNRPSPNRTAYVETRAAERLLEEAHERGRQLGFIQAQETIQDEIRKLGHA